jgi:glycolate oxidase iron-sulfur subunit
MKRAGTLTLSRPAPLERFRKDLAKCVRCGMCRAVCPPFLTGKSETHSARGRMALAAAVLDGRLSASAAFKERLMTCVGCLACEAACPSGVPVASIIEAAKEEAVRESGPSVIERALGGLFSSETALRSLAWLAPAVLRYRPAGAGGILPFSFRPFTDTMPDVVPADRGASRGTGPARVALFAGCAVNHVQKDVARAAVSVLTALGCDVVIPKGEVCCGRPMLSLGDRETAAELARHNAALLTRLAVDAVVTVCASCGLTFKKEYPALLRPEGTMPPVMDVHEVIRERLSGAALAPAAGSETHTYHVPCHLGRGQGLATTFRDLIHAVPGLVVRDPVNPEQCCGFGGIMRVTHHGLSVEIGREKAKDVIATGASVVVTGCPGCRLQLSDTLRRAGSAAQVVHTVQVLEKALGSAEPRVGSAEREMTGPKVKGPGSGK